jgi:hypothetical protein
MSVAAREPGSLPYASHEHLTMQVRALCVFSGVDPHSPQNVTQKIQTSPAVSSGACGAATSASTATDTSHFKVKTDVTLSGTPNQLTLSILSSHLTV